MRAIYLNILKIKRVPNTITIIRIALSMTLLFIEPFSMKFFMVYTISILSDLLDGFFARKFNAISQIGSKLDSLADFFLFLIILLIIFPYILVSLYFWYGFIFILFLRTVAILICMIRFRKLAILHTVSNKMVGFLCIVIPFVVRDDFFEVYAFFLIFVGILSAVEEILIHVRAKRFYSDCKSLIGLNTVR